MRRYSRIMLVLLVAVMLGVTSTAPIKAKSPGIIADIITTYNIAGGRQVTARGRYYRSHDGRVREDSALGAVITDMKKRTLTLVNFDHQEAIVFAIPKKEPTVPGEAKNPAVPVGNAIHDGRSVTKAHVKTVDGRTQEIWTDDDIGLVVLSKLETPTTTTVRELKNVARSEPQASVFDIPHGYSVRRDTLPSSLSASQRWQTPGNRQLPQR
jgi:hypothetical protein